MKRLPVQSIYRKFVRGLKYLGSLVLIVYLYLELGCYCPASVPDRSFCWPPSHFLNSMHHTVGYHFGDFPRRWILNRLLNSQLRVVVMYPTWIADRSQGMMPHRPRLREGATIFTKNALSAGCSGLVSDPSLVLYY
jgi:hypothetical protein